MKTRPGPPRPDAVRKGTGGFGWLDARLLNDRWLARLGPDAIAVMALLALAADRNGVSYYARDSMAVATGLDVLRVDRALAMLIEHGLVAMRPWRNGRKDGVWQLLPMPELRRERRAGAILTASQLLERLGFGVQ